MPRLFWFSPQIRHRLGLLMMLVGQYIVGLFFWLEPGFYLGGDPYFLDFFLQKLSIEFPFFGVGLGFVFFGYFLSQNNDISKTKKNPFKQKSRENQLLFILLFLFVLGFLAQNSIRPYDSFLWLIIWSLGFFALGIGNTFSFHKKSIRNLFSLGLVLGSGFYFLDFSQFISLQILSIMAFFLLIFGRVSGDIPWFKLILYSLIIGLSLNFWFLIFFILFWSFPQFWLAPRVRNRESWGLKIFPIMIFLPFLGSVLFFPENITPEIAPSFPFFSDWNRALLGFGEGQFLTALPYRADFYLTSDFFQLPTFGITLGFFELGFLGIIAILSLSLIPILQNSKNWLLSFCFFIVFCFYPDFLSSENGILMGLIFLFSEEDS